MKEQSKKENKEKVHTIMPTEISIKDIGLMTSNMAMEKCFMQMAIVMMDSGPKERKMDLEHISFITELSIEEILKIQKNLEKEPLLLQMVPKYKLTGDLIILKAKAKYFIKMVIFFREYLIFH